MILCVLVWQLFYGCPVVKHQHIYFSFACNNQRGLLTESYPQQNNKNRQSLAVFVEAEAVPVDLTPELGRFQWRPRLQTY